MLVISLVSVLTVMRQNRQMRDMQQRLIDLQAALPSSTQVVTKTDEVDVVTPPANQEGVAASGMQWEAASQQDVAFSYPKGWYVAVWPDSFVENQQNLRLTSALGELRIGGGPGMPGVIYFEKGYQLTLKEIHANQYTELTTTRTVNRKVMKLVITCDDAGCTDEQYVFEKDGHRYLIEVYNRMESKSTGDEVTRGFIASLKYSTISVSVAQTMEIFLKVKIPFL
jgi:hypothetical protein